MITILSGTNRNDAYSYHIAKKAESDLKEMGVETSFCDLNKLPRDLFVPEHYWNTPQSFQPFVDQILNADAVLIVVPEYNGSFPGVLKYFIDLLPFPQSFENKWVAFVGVADGRFGALRSIEQLTQILQYRKSFIYNDKMMFMGVHKVYDVESGKITDDNYANFYKSFLDGFASFISKLP
jgi:NAD(P)H-dependent FMN reductase